MAAALGVGVIADDMFRRLDCNHGGTVSIGEMLACLASHEMLDRSIREVLSDAMWPSAEGPHMATCEGIRTSGWQLTASSVAGLREQIKVQVAQSGATVADILHLFDIDAGGERLIDQMEFLNGLRDHFHFKGSAFLIEDLFRSIDADGSGFIGFDELFEFLKGYRHSLDRRSRHVPAATC